MLGLIILATIFFIVALVSKQYYFMGFSGATFIILFLKSLQNYDTNNLFSMGETWLYLLFAIGFFMFGFILNMTSSLEKEKEEKENSFYGKSNKKYK